MVDSPTGPWRARAPVLIAALAVLGATACAHTRRPAAELTVTCGAPGAMLYVDDRLWGSARELAARGLRLEAGKHRIELRGDGFFSVEREIVLNPGERMTLSVELHPVPPGVAGF